jgi:ribosome-associated protein
LRDAVLLARRITAHGGLARQKQYIGKLMRRIDVTPIRDAMSARSDRQRVEALQFRRIEQWRDRIVAEGRPAIDLLLADDTRVDREQLVALALDARRQQDAGKPPHAARELFRRVRDILAGIS